MQIRVSTGNCRLAVAAAAIALATKIDEARTEHWNRHFEALKTGAAHNGLHIDAAREAEMREMVDRDINHMFEKHPAKDTLDVLSNFGDMLNYHSGDDIVIDDQDFHLLKDHLPAPFSEELAQLKHAGT